MKIKMKEMKASSMDEVIMMKGKIKHQMEITIVTMVTAITDLANAEYVVKMGTSIRTVRQK